MAPKKVQIPEENKEWRIYFPDDLLEKAERLAEQSRAEDPDFDERSASVTLHTGQRRSYQVAIHNAPARYDQDWNPHNFYCSCLTKRSWGVHRNGRYRSYSVCQHEAALLLLWERRRGGPWIFPLPDEIREKLERKRRREEEKAARAERKKREEKLPADPGELFPGRGTDGTFYDVGTAAAACRSNLYALGRARELLEGGTVQLDEPKLDFDNSGEQLLTVRAAVSDELEQRELVLRIGRDKIQFHRCQCRPDYEYYYATSSALCEHELAALVRLRDYVLAHDPGDATDLAAAQFFDALENASAQRRALDEDREKPRNRVVTLSPRLLLEGGELKLTFKAGLAGERQLILRGIRELLDAAESRRECALSKKVTVDFSLQDFTEDSVPWVTFLQRRVSETDVVNDRLQASRYYAPSLAVKTRDTLSGAHLDRFYELAEGGDCAFRDNSESADRSIRIGHAPPRVTLSTQRIAGADGRLLGVAVTGKMPVILRGSAGSYVLAADSLSRITAAEEQVLRPFQAAADEGGNIRFQVGKNALPEFYYRVLPRLAESPCVDLEDNCAAEAEALLPPEPAFTFRLDTDEQAGVLTCLVLVAYGDAAPVPILPHGREERAFLDVAQESRALTAVSGFFPDYDGNRGLFQAPWSEDEYFRILTEGVRELGRLGTVEGSDAFRRNALRPMPQLRVGVSLESGLLDISVLSRDMSPEELLGVLESYRQKKRYHRLRSGDFVELEGDRQFADLEELASRMGLSAEDAIRGKATAPMYRALYLDTLLEEHDALAAGRDRTYRALVKNFKTIRDAEYEAPEAQAETLRPYQVYGYKWLRTLAEAGFGGILADEMGLGKTLQAIALLQALRESGDAGPCLIVCPASLVYNWQEEFRRFAPALPVRVIAGLPKARKSELDAGRDEGAVCITSYDLLRQDIADFQSVTFSTAVLDEAQYIKNQKAGITKAVKAVRATRRFALTGTPIENRLAELWSIFDFLMPGFLFSYTEFSRRFETPITRQKDPAATESLKKLTGPFILRRKKAEVLKDLPPKLEEVRYTRFEREQRQVYDGQVVRMKQLLLSSGTAGEDRIRILAELTRIRQICCDPSLLLEDYRGGSAKRAACMELIRSAAAGGHRMLVFSQFTSMLALLEEDLRSEGMDYFKLTGSTPKEQRLRMVRDFNEGETPVFLISLKAGGTGLNLTGADVVIHYDPWWNLAAQNQATDRAHRIGQENQVTVYRIIAKDTIEEKILALQEAKRDLADSVITGDGKNLSALSNEELLGLLE